MSNPKNKNMLIGCLCALGCETLFGLSYAFTKQATGSASPLALLGWRFVVAAIVMSVCILPGWVKINLKGKSLKPLLVVALFTPVIYFMGETMGISRTTASESGIFLACIPVASLVASGAILHKKPSRRQAAGILLTLAGVTVTVLAAGAEASLSPVGYLCLLAAVVSYALYSVFVEKASGYTETEITYIMLVVGAAVFGVLAIAEATVNGNVGALAALPVSDPQFLLAILYQGIGCSVLAFFMSNVAIVKIGVNGSASFIGASTVVSIISGVLILQESLSPYQIIGATVIIAGVYIANASGAGEKLSE